MNSWGENQQITQHQRYPGQPPVGYAEAPHDEEQQTNILLVIHRTLRGRYLWAIILAVVFGAAGGYGGFNFKNPTFMSMGQVQVRREIQTILFKDLAEAERLDAFDNFVNSQMGLVQSGRVLTLAAEDEKLQGAGWASGTAGVTALRSRLFIQSERGKDFFQVGVEHETPRLSMLATNAVLDTYKLLYGDQVTATITERQRKIEERIREKENDLENSRNAVILVAEQFGTPDLDQLYEAKLAELLETSNTLSEIKQALMEADLTASVATNEDETDEPSDVISVELLATADAELAALITQRNNLEATLESSLNEYGPGHPQTRRLKRQIEQKESEINRRADDLRKLVADGQLTLTNEDQPLVGTQSVDKLQTLLARYEARHAELTRDLRGISNARDRISALREEQARITDQLNTAKEEYEKISFERERIQTQGRIAVHHGALPSGPYSDKRKQFAALGGGGGFMLGFGLIWLYGFLRPSYRYVDELERNERHPILGTLPDLAGSREQEMAMASLSIHHLRNVLTLQSRRMSGTGIGTSYMISSARPGDGKTSLALALAMSFASEGNRTVMLDADLIGRGLSRSLELDGPRGFVDLLEQHGMEGCVHQTHVINMWAVPCGTAGSRKPEELSIEDFRHVVDVLKSQFDTVIIDTGPVLGSLEANLGAAIADYTILTVARGQDPRVVKAALRRLDQIGGRCAGLVFNKASRRDLSSNLSHVSLKSQSMRPQIPNAEAPRTGSSAQDGDPAAQGDRKALVRALMEQTSESPKKPTGDWAMAE